MAGALVIAIGLSAVIGLLLFSPRSYAWLGLVVCVPIGLVAAGIGFAADALARRFAVVGRALVVLGFVAIAVSALTSFANWDG